VAPFDGLAIVMVGAVVSVGAAALTAPKRFSRMPLAVAPPWNAGFTSPVVRMMLRNCAVVRPALRDSTSAAAPATCGEAIDVPLSARTSRLPAVEYELPAQRTSRLSM